ncbi:hypothetical protein PPTG_09586 [Phytophthora nicotianae INRA-310]|uniref:RING-type domain-containing protein n=1 Tax=Phytophthora nicotianae (strain INRA-310) TaxID=761204 RepID=W2QGC1_PHYN3|nr:hypothetical protein PPTG_09586 [Phytophthora nicotianae INRA-310]ETN11921.1 hypothetical protein PPTG_09586 [Phytophthora nicotianae INRA-310]
MSRQLACDSLPASSHLPHPSEVRPVKASFHRSEPLSSRSHCRIRCVGLNQNGQKLLNQESTGANTMELQLSVTVRYVARHSDVIGDVLGHFESPAWVRLVLRQTMPQLKQISPTDPNELTKMVRNTENSAKQETNCAICMGEEPTDTAPVELPCSHRFHSTCAQSWLQRRSTCPLCRFQLPTAYTGTFAIVSVRSTLLLPPELDGLSLSGLQVQPVGGQILQATVTITMTRIPAETTLDTAKRRRSCQVSVDMLHANGSSALTPLGRNAKRKREEKSRKGKGYDAKEDVCKRARMTA